MVFQIIDEKQGCFGVYTNGQFIYDRIPSGLRRTWTWSDHLSSGDFDFAFLWAGGKSLSEVCPDSLRPRLEAHEKKIKSHIKSFVNAKVNVQESCLFDLVPETHLRAYLETKNMICQHVFENILVKHDPVLVYSSGSMIASTQTWKTYHFFCTKLVVRAALLYLYFEHNFSFQ